MTACLMCGRAVADGLQCSCQIVGDFPHLAPPSLPQDTRRGWQCPVCRKVHAPFVAGCDCHKEAAR